MRPGDALTGRLLQNVAPGIHTEHLVILEFRQIFCHGIGQQKSALLVQLQHCRAGDDLGHGSQTADGVQGKGLALFNIRIADAPAVYGLVMLKNLKRRACRAVRDEVFQ